jgi:hypothetical protein
LSNKSPQPPKYNGDIDGERDRRRAPYNYHQHRIEHRADE